MFNKIDGKAGLMLIPFLLLILLVVIPIDWIRKKLKGNQNDVD